VKAHSVAIDAPGSERGARACEAAVARASEATRRPESDVNLGGLKHLEGEPVQALPTITPAP
jgi:hypothetical protein